MPRALITSPRRWKSDEGGQRPFRHVPNRTAGCTLGLLLALGSSVGAVQSDDPPGAVAQAAASCTCPQPYAPETPPGIAWQGPGPSPALPEIATLLAPVLWFSSDEPLVVLRNTPPPPHPHPHDRPSTGPVVYYQATVIVLRGNERVAGTGEADSRFFEKVDHFVLKYFFYYDEDRGFNPHAHDLEAINLLVDLDRAQNGCNRIRLRRVEGLAHGLRWYSNIQRVERDTVLPITVLVEEGKHASVPDRNGDGVYTPGYDVNTRVNDAWGLRDVLGSSVLQGARYTASMSKPRIDAFRLLPPAETALCGQRRVSRSDDTQGLGRYELRAASSVPLVTAEASDQVRLHGMMRSHRFGAAWPPEQHESDVARELSDPENAFEWISAVNARFDSGRVGLAVQGPGWDLREAWLVPRVLVNRDWAAEALLTPSASRWADWYVAFGYERGVTPRRPAVESRNGFASEVGIKMRLTVSGRARWALLGYHFAGVRVGVRANGFSHLRQPRLIMEFGAGAF